MATTPAGVAFSSGRGWKVRTHFNYSCLTAGLTVLAQLRRLRIPHTPRRLHSACVLKHGLGRIYHKFFFALPPGRKIFQLPPSQSLLERPRGIPGGLSSAPQCSVLRASYRRCRCRCRCRCRRFWFCFCFFKVSGADAAQSFISFGRGAQRSMLCH